MERVRPWTGLAVRHRGGSGTARVSLLRSLAASFDRLDPITEGDHGILQRLKDAGDSGNVLQDAVYVQLIGIDISNDMAKSQQAAQIGV